MLRKPIDRFLTDAQVAIDNARADAALQAALARFGYSTDRLDEGAALLREALARHTVRSLEQGEQADATARLQRAYDEAHAIYMRHVTLARVAFKDDPGTARATGMSGRREKTLSGWLLQARQFYDNLLATPERVAAMAAFGQAEEDLIRARDAVEAVAAANTRQEQEKGDAQRATRERDDAFEALQDWMSDFLKVARVALADDRQQLEKLGVVARA